MENFFHSNSLKRYLTACFCIVFAIKTSTAQFEEQTGVSIIGVEYSSVAWGDYNNDGFMDFIIGGDSSFSNPYIPMTQLYKNNGDGTFTKQTAIPFAGIKYGSVTWGDYNNDGFLDILITGQVGDNNYGWSYISKIYKNNGDGTFSELSENILPGVSFGSATWGDYNNDGAMDILLTGMSDGGSISKIYRNNGDNTFTALPDTSLVPVYYSSMAWGDYNNDGFLDILLTGHPGNYSLEAAISKIYKNNGDGTFSEQTDISLTGVYMGSGTWGDYNNDGFLDILLTGTTYPYDSLINGFHVISKIYKNNGDGTFSEQTDIALTGVQECSVAWGDYNRDGFLDILLTGYGGVKVGLVSKIYKNNGDGTFTEQKDINLPPICGGAVAWGDYNNDGLLDILLAGSTGQTTKIAKIYTNNGIYLSDTTITPPNLSQEILTDSSVMLSWGNPATRLAQTKQKDVSYNIRMGKTPGGIDILSPMASNFTGYRRKPDFGNSGKKTDFTITSLPPGSYYWSVQAIDNAFMGGAWSTENSFTISTTGINDTICSGGTTSIDITNPYDVGATYTWVVLSNPGGVTGAGAGNGTPIVQTLTNPTNTQQTVTYRITPKSGANLIGPTYDVKAIVNPVPTILATPSPQTLCSGQNTGITISNPNNVTGTTFAWTVVQSGVSGATAGSGTTISHVLSTTGSATGTATYTITPTAGSCSGIPLTLVVTVNPLPDAIAGNDTICSGAMTSIVITNPNGAGATYTWVVQSNPGGVTGAVAGSGTPIGQMLTNPTNTQQTVTYKITPKSGAPANCIGPTYDVEAIVDPVPTALAAPSPQTICSGQNTGITISNPNNVTGTTFAWTVVQSGVSGATAGSGTTISHVLSTTGSATGTATYTITPTAGSCSGTPATLVVTVHPIPDATASNDMICSGSTTTIAISTPNGVTGVTYNWTVVQNGVSGATAGSGTTISHVLSTTGPVAGTATYTITPTAGSCSGTPITLVVTVNPLPDATASNDTIWSGSTTTIVISTPNGVTGVTYNWTVVQNGVSGAAAGSSTPISQVLSTTGTTQGTATYTVTPAAAGCSGTPISVVAAVNPLPDAIASKDIISNTYIIYPNPAKDFLRITSEKSELCSITILNLSGNVLYDEQIYEKEEQINLSDLKSGLYLIKLKTRDNMNVLKLIVQK